MQTASAGPAYAGRTVRSWGEFAALPDDGYRYEIDNGRLFVTPAPLGPHQVVMDNLVARLKAACPGVHGRVQPDRLGAVRRGSGSGPPA
jgi:hypothetical protein